jgi:GNAT superfamily N-acetyltransferase
MSASARETELGMQESQNMMSTLRQANIHDLEKIVPLFDGYRQFYEQSADPALARNFLRERFAHHESTIFLALDARDQGIGFVQLYPLFGSVRCVRKYLLNDLFVLPAARGCGIGAALLKAAADFARANGAAALTLSTAIDNLPAQKLYAALGWQRDAGYFEYNLDLNDAALAD